MSMYHVPEWLPRVVSYSTPLYRVPVSRRRITSLHHVPPSRPSITSRADRVARIIAPHAAPGRRARSRSLCLTTVCVCVCVCVWWWWWWSWCARVCARTAGVGHVWRVGGADPHPLRHRQGASSPVSFPHRARAPECAQARAPVASSSTREHPSFLAAVRVASPWATHALFFLYI